LEEDEQILDLEVTRRKPRCRVPRPWFLQIQGITIVTNLRRITWDSDSSQVSKVSAPSDVKIISQVVWNFNAIYDDVKCIY
jgi:hypothetical protein